MSLFKHQVEGINFIMERKGTGALFWEMGLGKTRGALHLYERIREKVPGVRMLVIAPLSLLEGAWGEDIHKFTRYTYHNIHKAGAPSLDKDVHGRPRFLDIVVTNYESILSERVRGYIKEMTKAGPWLCVLDESSKIKNQGSKTTKHLLEMARLFSYRVIMSGTPAPNSEMEYWPQMQFIKPGLLHPSFYGFRNKFFYLRNRYTGAEIPQGARLSRQMLQDVLRKCDYAMTTPCREHLLKEISTVAHFAKKKDCLDLPPVVDEIRKVQLSKEQKAAYEQMRQHLILELKDETITAPVALTKVMKLRQITSGFVYTEDKKSVEIDGAIGKEKPATAFPNPKIDELMDVIEQSGDAQVIIWIQFHWELIKICHELHAKFGTDSVVTLASTTDDRDESIQAFKKGKARFLVAHPRSAAHGLTFVNCSLQVFFCLDYSWEAYEQARARTDRYGQTKSSTYVHLLAEGTIDEAILAVLQRKGDAQKLVYEILRPKK